MKTGTKHWLLISAAIALLGIAVACNPGDAGNIRSTGSYPIDIFQEMHYNQSFKSQEPPRLDSAPQSVPWRGFAEAPSNDAAGLVLTGSVALPRLKSDAKALSNPIAKNASANQRAANLFAVNCSMCHGKLADAKASEDQAKFVGQMFGQYRIVEPPSFESDRIQSLTPGESFWSITNGSGFMPSFGNLLDASDRWHLVHLIQMESADRKAILHQTTR